MYGVCTKEKPKPERKDINIKVKREMMVGAFECVCVKVCV